MVDVVFPPEKIRRLKRAYTLALSLGLTQFTFDGVEYVTSYAKYLIEYLEQQTRSL